MKTSHVPWGELARIAEQNLPHGPEISADAEKLAEILLKTGMFDSQYYLAAYPDVPAAGLEAIVHYARHGWKERRNPAIWFDSRFYCRENFDACLAEQDAFLHFLAKGFQEGRRPNAHKRKRRGRLIVATAVDANHVEMAGQALRSLQAQSLAPDRILVYLPDSLSRPLPLPNMAGPQLEFRWREDLGEYNCSLHALADFPNDVVVICAPWLVYERDWLARLYAAFQDNAQAIHCARASLLLFNDGAVTLGDIAPGPLAASLFNLPASEFGMLVPPRLLRPAEADVDDCQRQAPDFPDVWFWARAVADGVAISAIGGESAKLPDANAIAGDTGRHRKDKKELERQLMKSAFHLRKNINKKLGINVFGQFLKNRVKNIYKAFSKKEIDFTNCATYNQKLQYIKIYDDDPAKTICADKYAARNWIATRLGTFEYLPRLYGVWDDASDIDFSILPKSYVLKPNHASGRYLVIRDSSTLDIRKTVETLDSWLKINYTFAGCETHYFDIIPRIICEELLGDNLVDYRCMCFAGKVVQIWVDYDHSRTRNIYTPQWQFLECEIGHPRRENIDDRPHHLDLMLDIAEKLSAPFPHVRVDFFILPDGRLKIGELTFTSQSGCGKFSSEEVALQLGAQIDLARMTFAPGN